MEFEDTTAGSGPNDRPDWVDVESFPNYGFLSKNCSFPVMDDGLGDVGFYLETTSGDGDSQTDTTAGPGRHLRHPQAFDTLGRGTPAAEIIPNPPNSYSSIYLPTPILDGDLWTATAPAEATT